MENFGRMGRYIERGANVAVIVGVAVFIGIAFRGNLFHRFIAPEVRSSPPGFASLAGTKVSIPGIQLPQRQGSLLIVVSTKCHFCEESLPFYQKLVPAIKSKVNVIAVLPQPKPEAEAWLHKPGITGTQIAAASPDSIGVTGTPTLLLVDGTGKVKSAWIGRLDEPAQQQVTHALLQ